ncbi:SGM_5486 family transporter-associated protein [Streptomyces marincola]|nr:SGM_5486 family transporter-associated protein [Streptomyces marincola]
MPALDPNPAGGQRKLLLILGAMLGISVVIAVIAVVASP